VCYEGEKAIVTSIIVFLSVLNRFYSLVTDLATAQEAMQVVKKQAEGQQKEYLKLLGKELQAQSTIDQLNQELAERDRSKNYYSIMLYNIELMIDVIYNNSSDQRLQV
jgi:uncharacterized membrane protein (DUF106 family)